MPSDPTAVTNRHRKQPRDTVAPASDRPPVRREPKHVGRAPFFDWRRELLNLARESDAGLFLLLERQRGRWAAAQESGQVVSAAGRSPRSGARSYLPFGHPRQKQLLLMGVQTTLIPRISDLLEKLNQDVWWTRAPEDTTKLLELEERLTYLAKALEKLKPKATPGAVVAIRKWQHAAVTFCVEEVLGQLMPLCQRIQSSQTGARRRGGPYSALLSSKEVVFRIHNTLVSAGMAKPVELTARILEWWWCPPFAGASFERAGANVFKPRLPWIHAVRLRSTANDKSGESYEPYEYVGCAQIGCEPDLDRPWLPPIHCPLRKTRFGDFLRKHGS